MFRYNATLEEIKNLSKRDAVKCIECDVVDDISPDLARKIIFLYDSINAALYALGNVEDDDALKCQSILNTAVRVIAKSNAEGSRAATEDLK